jgi:hypothetical protein
MSADARILSLVHSARAGDGLDCAGREWSLEETPLAEDGRVAVEVNDHDP